jgi:chromosome segregation ATPase
MQDKMKFVLIGLAAAIIIMLFLLLQSGQYVGKLKTERDVLKETNNSLNTQLANLNKENNQIKEEFNTVKKSLETLNLEKTDAEKSFKSLTEERDKLKSALGQLNAQLNAGQAGGQEVRPRTEEAVSPTADAYWAGILKKKAELELKLDNLRQDLKAAKLENEQLKRDKDRLGIDMQSYETEQKDAAREFEYNRKLADNLTAELTREKTDKFQMADTLKALKNENRFLKQQLKIIYDRKTKLEEKFSVLQDKNAALESNMAKMESFVREKILQVDSLKGDLGIMSSTQVQGKAAPRENTENISTGKSGSIELAPIVVRPQEESYPKTPGQAGKETSVIAVNRDNNFVIIGIGSNSGVKVGDTFQIFRKEDPVAIVKVIQARENISACDINSENTPIAVGDTVR